MLELYSYLILILLFILQGDSGSTGTKGEKVSCLFICSLFSNLEHSNSLGILIRRHVPL